MPSGNFTFTVVRPDDLLVAVFRFENVQLTPPAGSAAGAIEGTSSARLLVELQPQHIAEQAFFQESQDHQDPMAGDEFPAPPGNVQARLSGPSRLVFAVPAGEKIPLTVAGVLEALHRLPLLVAPVASYSPPGCMAIIDTLLRRRPVVMPPAADVTAIEAPYRLFLSPDHEGKWSHALEPVTEGDWTELWHTRLGSGRSDGDPRVRAIWSPDFIADSLQVPDNNPFRMSLDGLDRNEIVHLTSNWNIPGFQPTPVATERFMLSTLGVWLDVEGTWDPPVLNAQNSLSVVNWRHEARMARDQYVRVIRMGYLLPYGHKAVLVKITERKFFYREDARTPGNIAYLYQRKFILVREPTRTYSRRDMPLRRITFKTRVTPNLVKSEDNDINGLGDGAFWPHLNTGSGTVPFQFHLRGSDWGGNEVEWTSPLVFVSKNIDMAANIGPILTEYNDIIPVTDPLRRRPLSGQPVAFAPSKKEGDTTFDVVDVSFEAVSMPGGTGPADDDGPHFRPALKQANVDVPAVKQLLGKNVPSTIEWEASYLSGSGSSIGNAGDVFAKLIGSTGLSFDTEKVGGMVAPNIDISGLSRSLGPVGGPVQQMVGGNFKPEDIFGAGVKLLGGIDLWEIVKDLVFGAASTTADKIPGLTTERIGDVLRTRYSWSIGNNEMVQNHPLFRPTGSSTFTLEAIVDAPLDGTSPTFTATGSLTAFSVTLLPTPPMPEGLHLVDISFNSVSFTAEPNKQPDVSVDLGSIDFTGILEFVKRLQENLPLNGFGASPNFEIVSSPASGIDLGFTLAIPSIGIGVMTMQNISLTAGFFLPFGDAPLNFHFAFCERQQPFILTVSLFGGGGFFGIDIGLDGVKMIEAALEFGASVAINLGVASGEASIMAGFYFQMAGSDFELTGYFRAYGSLSVLGIITVSLEFYLGLTYASKAITPHGGTLWGQASLKVKIEILFFSVSVSVSMEREFAGSDPKFRQLVGHDDWSQYVDAFAPYPA